MHAKALGEITKELRKIAQGKCGDPLACLKESLFAAIQLEFATIPPYLLAGWSIEKDDSGGEGHLSVAQTIREVAMEEMAHLGFVANMLVAIDPKVDLDFTKLAPSYPATLPGNVNPELIVPLRRLTPSQLQVFMEIEHPEYLPHAPVSSGFPTIGDFYDALLGAFFALKDQLTFDVGRQQEGTVPFTRPSNPPADDPIPGTRVFQIQSVDSGDKTVKRAIDIIRAQGEGANQTPEEEPGQLAHYYQFSEVFHGNYYDVLTGLYSGRPYPFPIVRPMADIPQGGYQQVDVTNEVWQKLVAFDSKYTLLLKKLTEAWRGDQTAYRDAVREMLSLREIGVQLMNLPRPDGLGNYGPNFRVVT